MFQNPLQTPLDVENDILQMISHAKKNVIACLTLYLHIFINSCCYEHFLDRKYDYASMHVYRQRWRKIDAHVDTPNRKFLAQDLEVQQTKVRRLSANLDQATLDQTKLK